jgi:hypothetical protein
MSDRTPTDPIEALLAQAAKAPAPPLPPAFAARLLQEARAVQAPPPRAGLVMRLWGWMQPVGGLPGVAGMGLAALTGLWLGLAGITPADAFVPLNNDSALIDLLASDTPWEILP